MRLMWIGLAESAVALAVGFWMVATLPASSVIWGQGVLAFAGLSLVASLLLGRGGDEEADDASSAAPAPPSAPVPALPAPAVSPLPPPELPRALLPEPVTHLQREALRSRWVWQAREAALQLAALAESDGTGDGARHLRRRTDATILRQGFEALAAGDVPEFHLDDVRRGWTRDLIQGRLAQLAQAEEDVRAEADPWLDPDDDDRGARLAAAAARHRYDMLQETAARWEQLAVLTMGYKALLTCVPAAHDEAGGEGSGHAATAGEGDEA